MVDYTPRAPEKFTNDDGSASYTFPVDDLEWEPTQGFRKSLAGVIGAHYGHDFAGGSPWAKDFGLEAVRFNLWGTDAEIDAAFDDCVGTLINIGAGKLWAIDAAGDRRWCYAKLEGLPEKTVDSETLYKLPVSTRFTRESDWYSELAVTVTRTAVVAVPHDFTATNPGNAPTTNGYIRIRSNGVAGFETPVVLNLSNAYTFSVDRVAVDADSEAKVDFFESSALWSANNGATYADDYANFIMGATQVGFFQLEAGDNLIRYSDDDATPDVDLVLVFFPAWHSA